MQWKEQCKSRLGLNPSSCCLLTEFITGSFSLSRRCSSLWNGNNASCLSLEMVMSIKWGEEYWRLRPCSMSLVSWCQLWRLRPCRSWPRSGLHVLKPPSWLVPSESYQAVLPTGPTFPCSRPAEPGLRMPGGDLNADLKRTLSGQLLPRGRIAWREEDAFVWRPLLRVRLREWRRLDLSPSAAAAAPPPPTAPCPGAFMQCTQCTAVPSGPEQCHPLHLHPGSSSPAWCAGFWPIHYIYVLKPLVLLYVTVL